MPRLFVAIDLPDSHAASLSHLRDEALPARWTPEHQYHLTLRFLGDVADAAAPDVEDALREIRHDVFTARGNGLGVFPSRRKPRVLFAGVELSPALRELRDAVEDAVTRCGLPPDTKPFTPHITIARLKQARPREVRQYLRRHDGVALDPFEVTTFHLYASTLRSSGAVHERVRTYPLMPVEADG